MFQSSSTAKTELKNLSCQSHGNPRDGNQDLFDEQLPQTLKNYLKHQGEDVDGVSTKRGCGELELMHWIHVHVYVAYTQYTFYIYIARHQHHPARVLDAWWESSSRLIKTESFFGLHICKQNLVSPERTPIFLNKIYEE